MAQDVRDTATRTVRCTLLALFSLSPLVGSCGPDDDPSAACAQTCRVLAATCDEDQDAVEACTKECAADAKEAESVRCSAPFTNQLDCCRELTASSLDCSSAETLFDRCEAACDADAVNLCFIERPGGGDAGHGGDAGDAGDAGDSGMKTPAHSGDCTEAELLRVKTSVRTDQTACHKFSGAPIGVYYSEDICIQFNADGTARIDSMGGYDAAPIIVGNDWKREDAVGEFRWGALVDSQGSYLLDRFEKAFTIYMMTPEGQTAIVQAPLLYWKSELGAFSNRWPEYVLSPPEEEVRSAACMFGPPRCLEVNNQKSCYADGFLEGEYQRWDQNKKIVEEGQYARGVRTGTWTSYVYTYEGNYVSHEEKTYDSQDKDSYSYRRYQNMVLAEEGSIHGGKQHGRKAVYFPTDDPSSSTKSYYNASHLVREESFYEAGTLVGMQTTNFVRYDIEAPVVTDFPKRADYDTARAQYLEARRGVDVCPSSVWNHDTGGRTGYTYGKSACPVGICNAGLVLITQRPAMGELYCTNASGTATTCPSVICQ